jgi:hypothetical protein
MPRYNSQRLDELKRKYRPEMFKTEFCERCEEHDVDPAVHVCDPERVLAVARFRDPWSAKREQLYKDLQREIQVTMGRHLIWNPELAVDLVDLIKPYLSVGEDATPESEVTNGQQ